MVTGCSRASLLSCTALSAAIIMAILRVLADGTTTWPWRCTVSPVPRAFRYQPVWNGSSSQSLLRSVTSISNMMFLLFLYNRCLTKPLRDTAETISLLTYGLHARPGQERLPESRIRNACRHSINRLDGELDSGKGCLQVVLSCLRLGEEVSGLPGQRWVADLPGDA